MARLWCVKTARGRMLKLANVTRKQAASPEPCVTFDCTAFPLQHGCFFKHQNTAQKSLTFLQSSVNCSHLSTHVVPFKEQDLPTFSFPVLRCTWDWSPLTFYHFLLINWVQDSHLFSDSSWESFSQGSRWLLGALRESASLGSNRICYVCY